MLAAVAMLLTDKNTERSAAAPDSRDAVQVLKVGQICRAGDAMLVHSSVRANHTSGLFAQVELGAELFRSQSSSCFGGFSLVWSFSGCLHGSSMPLGLAFSSAKLRYICF